MNTQNNPQLGQISVKGWEELPEIIQQLAMNLQAQACKPQILFEFDKQLIQLLEVLPLGVLLCVPDSQIAHINSIGRKILALEQNSKPTLAQLLARLSPYRRGTQNPYPITELPIARVLAGEQVHLNDIDFHQADQVMALDLWVQAIIGEQGQILYILVLFQDSSCLKPPITHWQESEARQHMILMLNQVGTWDWDVLHNRLIWDDQTFDLLGIDRQTTPASYQAFLQVVHPTDVKSLQAHLQNTLKNGEEYSQEFRVLLADGSVRWLQARAQVFYRYGRPFRLLGILFNITDRKLAEERLRDQQAQLDLVVQASHVGFYISDLQTQTSYVSPAYKAQLGYGPQDVEGSPSDWKERLHPDDRERAVLAYRTFLAQQGTYDIDFRLRHHDGSYRWIHSNAQLICEKDGQPIKVVGTHIDITDRKQIELALKKQTERQQALNRVFQALRNSLDLDTIFSTATAETARLLQVSDCFVVQYLAPQELWKLVAEFRQDPEATSLIGSELADVYHPFSEQLKQLVIVQLEDTNLLIESFHSCMKNLLPGAWLVIPLVIEAKLWGSFALRTYQRPFSWQAEQIELAQAVADQLGIAIHQANLYQQVQQELAERCRAEAALCESEARFQKMADNVPGIIYGYRLRPDGSDAFTYLSSGFRDVYGIDPDDALADSRVVWKLTHPDDMSMLRSSIQESRQTCQTWHCQYRVITPAGVIKWLQGISRPVQQANGDVVWDGLIIDITDRKQAEAALRESEERYRLLAENMRDLVCLQNCEGRFIYVSPSCWTLLGYSPDELIGQTFYTFLHADDRERVRQETNSNALLHQPKPTTYRMRHRSGHYVWLETLTNPLWGATGQVIGLQTTSRDVTERIQVQELLRHDAMHDTLTGLPNRHLLLERLTLAILRTKRSEHYHFAVLFLDLDRFKVINDSLGHLTGDRVLIHVARKFQALLRSTDLAARLGGDEFVILLEEIRSLQEAVRVAERIFAELRMPLNLDGRDLFIAASIGIVFGSAHYSQAAELLRDADIAMYQAKAKGKGCYEIFDAEMHAEALRRLHLENDLRSAIQHHQFVLHYQPIIELETGTWAGLEALVRWQHPERGMISPAEFIPIAEETGLVVLIDHWVLQTACQHLADWQNRFPETRTLKVSVNLSAQDLWADCLVSEIEQILEQTHLSGSSLALEITESMLVEDVEATISLLNQLKARGIEISIDDFGTGYSSLNYLYQLPVNYLKIDRSFVNRMQEIPHNYKIVQTIISLAEQLGIKSVAEGIETGAQLEQLQQLGCDLTQGYFFSRPMTAHNIEQMIRERSQA